MTDSTLSAAWWEHAERSVERGAGNNATSTSGLALVATRRRKEWGTRPSVCRTRRVAGQSGLPRIAIQISGAGKAHPKPVQIRPDSTFNNLLACPHTQGERSPYGAPAEYGSGDWSHVPSARRIPYASTFTFQAETPPAASRKRGHAGSFTLPPRGRKGVV